MRKACLIVFVALTMAASTQSQELSYAQRLYYTCKVWGLVKYFHADVSRCAVDWDSVLQATLPSIKSATDVPQFNTAIASLLTAAGPVPVDTSPPPIERPPELRRNFEFTWIQDDALLPGVRSTLDSILTMFRPHESCHVAGQGNGNTITFPKDTPILDRFMYSDYPGEEERLTGFFSYWNIIRYFSPNNHILDTPWDSTLAQHVGLVAYAQDYPRFHDIFLRVVARLQDAHAQGMTYNSLHRTRGTYIPKLVLRHGREGYIVVKSDCADLVNGDVILAVDSKSTQEWEDSLRPYISAGSPEILRRYVRLDMLRGEYNTPVVLRYLDSTGTVRTSQQARVMLSSLIWPASYYPTDSLRTKKWLRFPCNVGYVNMGNIEKEDVDSMFTDLQHTSSIVFDQRNTPRSTLALIGGHLFTKKTDIALFMRPETWYPGVFYWNDSRFGPLDDVEPYTGKVIVLSNEMTQSHAEYTCMMFRAHANTVFVGSQTAGADGNVVDIQFSRDLFTGYTGIGVYYPDGTNAQRIGIIPDSLVELTAAGIRAGRDELLDKALEIAGCATNATRPPPAPIPDAVSLSQNFPNPFNPVTEITFELPSPGDVRLSVHDLLGREVTILVDDAKSAGSHRAQFDGSDLPSGVYCYRLMWNGGIILRKMMLMK